MNGKFQQPNSKKYVDTISPSSEEFLSKIVISNEKDVDKAVESAQMGFEKWANTTPHERSKYLFKLARLIQERSREFAVLESLDGGKPIKESRDFDLPQVAANFFYFAGWADKIDLSWGAKSLKPYGVVGQIIPWNFPLLMAAWKLAPVLATGNTVVLKPAEQTPFSINVLMEVIGDLLPAGVANIVHGYGVEAGKPLASSKRVKKVGFTGETTTGRLILQYASENLIPVTLELGGKSPNIYFKDIMGGSDDYISRCVEGFLHAYFNQGEVCTCPSRAIIHEDIYEPFMEMVKERVKALNCGSPFDLNTQVGAQASNEQFEKIMSYLDIGKQEGAEVLFGGEKREMNGNFSGGYYVEPTAFKGNNSMRIFQEEIFGPVVSVATFKDEAEAVSIANDTLYGLGAGVWSRDANICYRMGRAIEAGRVWVNCYHSYPAHAAFGGYKNSGIGRETHKMMLNHYQQTKNVLVSYAESPDGFF